MNEVCCQILPQKHHSSVLLDEDLSVLAQTEQRPVSSSSYPRPLEVRGLHCPVRWSKKTRPIVEFHNPALTYSGVCAWSPSIDPRKKKVMKRSSRRKSSTQKKRVLAVAGSSGTLCRLLMGKELKRSSRKPPSEVCKLLAVHGSLRIQVSFSLVASFFDIGVSGL